MSGSAHSFRLNSYTDFTNNEIAVNSLVATNGMFVYKNGAYIDVSGPSTNIDGVSITEKTFSSTNSTVAKDVLIYKACIKDQDTYRINVVGETILFSGDLITGNTINYKINGVAGTPVPFDVGGDPATLTALAAQIVIDFPTIVQTAASGTHLIKVKPLISNALCVITAVLVTGGVTQVTATITNNVLTTANVNSYGDIQATTNQAFDYFTLNSSATGLALRVKEIIGNGAQVSVNVVNA